MTIYGKKYIYNNGDKPDFNITFKNSSPRFFAHWIEKYEYLYHQAKENAKAGLLSDEKLEILKKQGAKRAMAHFMSALPDDPDEANEQEE
jgi:hypothetical protein